MATNSPAAWLNATTVVRAARDLASENGENPEYDRALVELTADLLRVDPDAGPVLRLLYPDPGADDLRAVLRAAITGRSA